MKRNPVKYFLLTALASLSLLTTAQTFQQPILISSAGQSADVKLVKMLASRENLDANTILMATPSDLEGIKTLIIVPGFSLKGLGAAGISQEDEMNRVEELVEAANRKEIPIVMMHIGGNARRKGQSDSFNSLIASNSKHMIVVAQGNEDNFFSDISNAKNIPLEVVEKISETGAPMSKLFH